MRARRRKIKPKKKAILGALIPAALNFGMGLANNAKQKREQEEAERQALAISQAQNMQQDNIRLENFKPEGQGIIDYYGAMGGKIPYANGGYVPSYATEGGNLKPLSSDSELAVGPKHAGGGIDLLDDTGKPFLEIEGGEVIRDGKEVYSDKLVDVNGKTYAENAERLAKEKGKIELDLDNTDSIGRATRKRRLKNIDRKEGMLFARQEASKTPTTNTEKAEDGFFIPRTGTGGTRGNYSKVNSPTNSFGNTKFGKALNASLPFIDNIGNAILTATTPELAKPITQKVVPLKTKYNVQPQINAITRAVDASTKNIKENTSSSAIARNEITSARLKGASAKANVMANKENVETQLHNRNVMNTQNVVASNNQILNRYNDRNFARSGDIQGRISQNFANFAGDLVDAKNFKAKEAYDKERLDIARQYNNQGTTRRSDLNNASEINRLKSDSSYASEQYRRYKGTPEEALFLKITGYTPTIEDLAY